MTALNAAGTPEGLERLLNLDDVEARARDLMPEVVYNFIAGGAADEFTVRWNRERFADLRLRQRVLQDLAGLDATTTLFGQRMPMPILLAPTAGHRYTHPEGELATARGAGAVGATMVLSSGTHTSIEDVMAVARAPVWYQLYVLKDRGLTAALVERVQAAGATALCVTVDSPLDGVRYRQQRLKLEIPPGVTYPHLAGVREPASIQTLDQVVPASLTWKDIEWLRSITRVPLLLKGVMSGVDAGAGIAAGADGIIVSNHGGRCLDTLPATIEVLPEVVAAVKGRVPVMVDGGIRRGTDVVKALALGAAAVHIGRPYVYGLAVGGAAGVEHVLKLLRQELLMAMCQLGCRDIPSITRDVLWRRD
ncbi:MAG: alpha-hydroxy acid oxidase [Candidatus Eisenbacteria bacterium]|nr:alpha-hydroxy acid oxidase [Candidatus Eisenbacteria bacterium]